MSFQLHPNEIFKVELEGKCFAAAAVSRKSNGALDSMVRFLCPTCLSLLQTSLYPGARCRVCRTQFENLDRTGGAYDIKLWARTMEDFLVTQGMDPLSATLEVSRIEQEMIEYLEE